MSNYYLDYHEADNGDLVDIDYYHRHCASPELRAKGGHPCPEWPGYTVVCAGCDETIRWAGIDRALAYDGSGVLFDEGEMICAGHVDFANSFRPEHWTQTDDTGACFICAENASIARAERSMT